MADWSCQGLADAYSASVSEMPEAFAETEAMELTR